MENFATVRQVFGKYVSNNIFVIANFDDWIYADIER